MSDSAVRMDGEKIIVPGFGATLAAGNLKLLRARTQTLQINVGLVCNQACRHCHLSAGPAKTELMSRATMDAVIEYQRRCRFPSVDITGGAPELNPDLPYLIENIRPLCDELLFRANLTALSETGREPLLDLLIANRVVIFASFPSLNESQADAQRGKGVFERSIKALKRLNQAGYGQEGSGLALNLVSNPAGAFLPSDQAKTEDRFRRMLAQKYDLVFNNLFAFANMPLGRFREWLETSGNLEGYLAKLHDAFNSCALEGVMCRSLVSVNWDGNLYDCDFNLAAGLPLGGEPLHVSSLDGPPAEGSPISIGDHCYACTAGSGFT